LTVEFIDGVSAGSVVSLDLPVRIGRHANNQLVLDGEDVAGVHAELSSDEQGLRVRDLGRSVWLDGVRVLDGYARSGSRLQVGDRALRLMFGEGFAQGREAGRFGELWGVSPPMQAVFGTLSRAAVSEATVLIEGETGTGKEGAAYAIHEASSRRQGPFVVVDCGAIPENLIESELFGHEKGAFTGAVNRHQGAFEQASLGTVFLDEVGELPLDLQPKLLRVLEQKTVRRLGSGERKSVSVRIVAATNRDLRAEVQAGRFRQDLYFRLSVLKVVLPPLRSRPEDFPLLVRALLERIGASPPQMGRFLAQPFLDTLAQTPWPGNVRELRNYLERCVVMDAELPLSEGRVDPPRAPGSTPPAAQAKSEASQLVVDPSMPYEDARATAIAEFERSYLKALLERHGGNVSQAAREAGMDRVYLHRLIRRHGIKG
jgi:two-component system response regulator GlrR